MNKLAGLLCVLFLVLGVSGTVGATPMDFTSSQQGTWGFTSTGVFNTLTEKTWNFDLHTAGVVDGDVITEGQLFIDVSDVVYGKPSPTIICDTLTWNDVRVWQGDPTYTVTYLLTDYLLAVTIKDIDPACFFVVSEVKVSGQYEHENPSDPNGVPDASIMFLLGPGLIGLGLFGRRKVFKK